VDTGSAEIADSGAIVEPEGSAENAPGEAIVARGARVGRMENAERTDLAEKRDRGASLHHRFPK
jgi:hypothetical protein